MEKKSSTNVINLMMKQLILNKDIWSISTNFIDMGSTIVLCTEGGAAENVEELLNSKYMVLRFFLLCIIYQYIF